MPATPELLAELQSIRDGLDRVCEKILTVAVDLEAQGGRLGLQERRWRPPRRFVKKKRKGRATS